MRSFLWAVPASVLVLASVGCTTGQRVKYDVNGDAVAVESPTYEPAASTAPAQAPVQVVTTDPTPAATPVPAAEPQPVPAVKPVPVAKSKPAKHESEAAAPAAAEGKTYVVQRGDTLQKISMKAYGTTRKWKKIQAANHLKGDTIRVGQKLILPEVK